MNPTNIRLYCILKTQNGIDNKDKYFIKCSKKAISIFNISIFYRYNLNFSFLFCDGQVGRRSRILTYESHYSIYTLLGQR